MKEMTKNETIQNANTQQSNGSTHRSNFSGAPSAHTKVILKIKQANKNDRQIKATFTNNEGNQVKELIPTFRDSDPGELLLELEKELLKFGSRYDLFQYGRWKLLGQIGGRALKGRIARYWSDIVEGTTNHSRGDSATQQAKFLKLIKKVNVKYFGKDAADDQKTAMLRGELRCNDQDYEKIAERLFEINKDLELLSDDIEKFSIREMAKLIIPENLKYQAKLKFVDKGGKNLRDEEEIIDLCRDIKEVLSIERQKDRCYNHHNSGSHQLSAEEKEKHDSAPCRKHDGAHKWKECPDNWHNKNRVGSNHTPAASNSSSTRN